MEEDLLTTLLGWANDFPDATTEARNASERARDFYDGTQWTSEEIEVLNDRNQPVVTLNRIAPKVNFVLGTEAKTRIDPRTYPRTPEHEDESIAVTDSLRAVADLVDFDQRRSAVAENLIIEGYGGCEMGIKEHIRGFKGGPDITMTHVPWDRIIYDPHSRKPDFSDALYLGTVVWWDVEELLIEFPDAADVVEATKHDTVEGLDDTMEDRPHKWFDAKRDRVQVVSMYWHVGAQWRHARYTRGGFVEEPKDLVLVDENGESYCPLLLTSAFVDRENNRYGMVKSLISPQEEINKRRSKALHLLSMRQVMAETGAVSDPQTAQKELAKPDGWVEVQPGAARDGTFQILDHNDLAQGQMALLQEAKSEIDTIGPHAALVAAEQSSRMSGRLFMARQQAGAMELEPIFDNLRSWQLQVFRVMWYMIRQFKTKEWWIRVRDEENKDGFRFVKMNRTATRESRFRELTRDGVPPPVAIQQVAGREGLKLYQMTQQKIQQEAQGLAQVTGQPPDPKVVQKAIMDEFMANDLMKEEYTENDVAKLDVDIVLDTSPDVAIIEHEEFQELIELAGRGYPIPPDIIIEASSLRSKKRLLAQMRQGPSPEQQAQQQLQIANLQAQVQKLTAQAQESQAKAAKAQAEAQIGIPYQAEADQARAMKDAAEAGISSVPDVEPVAPPAANLGGKS